MNSNGKQSSEFIKDLFKAVETLLKEPIIGDVEMSREIETVEQSKLGEGVVGHVHTGWRTDRIYFENGAYVEIRHFDLSLLESPENKMDEVPGG